MVWKMTIIDNDNNDNNHYNQHDIVIITNMYGTKSNDNNGPQQGMVLEQTLGRFAFFSLIGWNSAIKTTQGSPS